MSQGEWIYIISAYLLGSIPFGYISYYLFQRKDIREKGSGNIGATNVVRCQSFTSGVIVLVLDILKSVVVIAYGQRHFDSPAVILIGGAAVVLGHVFPLYLKFKGGRGVASFIGIFILFHFPSALFFGALFFLTVIVTRYISAGSIAGVLGILFFSISTQIVEVSAIVLVMAILIIAKHRGNIKRITGGNENKFSWKEKHG